MELTRVELTRRNFLKLSAASAAGAAWATFGFDLEPAYAQANELKISRAKEIRSVCPYCGVGCSMIAVRRPRRARATARLVLTDDLPTPPLPDATAMTLEDANASPMDAAPSPCSWRRSSAR